MLNLQLRFFLLVPIEMENENWKKNQWKNKNKILGDVNFGNHKNQSQQYTDENTNNKKCDRKVKVVIVKFH
jgi:hypothetical protein